MPFHGDSRRMAEHARAAVQALVNEARGVIERA
jgi:hypothetical protein